MLHFDFCFLFFTTHINYINPHTHTLEVFNADISVNGWGFSTLLKTLYSQVEIYREVEMNNRVRLGSERSEAFTVRVCDPSLWPESVSKGRRTTKRCLVFSVILCVLFVIFSKMVWECFYSLKLDILLEFSHEAAAMQWLHLLHHSKMHRQCKMFEFYPQLQCQSNATAHCRGSWSPAWHLIISFIYIIYLCLSCTFNSVSALNWI